MVCFRISNDGPRAWRDVGSVWLPEARERVARRRLLSWSYLWLSVEGRSQPTVNPWAGSQGVKMPCLSPPCLPFPIRSTHWPNLTGSQRARERRWGWGGGGVRGGGTVHWARLLGNRAGGKGWKGGKGQRRYQNKTEGQAKHNVLVPPDSPGVTTLPIEGKQPSFFPSSAVPLITFVAFLWVHLLPLLKSKIWLGVSKENQISKK